MSGNEIRYWRERTGQSRAWLAKQCGVSALTVEAWEQGLRQPGGSASLLLKQLMEVSNLGNDEKNRSYTP